jgi:hypothetical protein
MFPLCVLSLAMSGCDRTAPVANQQGVVVSSGVQIIEFARADQAPQWLLSSAPSTTIGSSDGPEEVIFDNIRGGLRLPDGDIIIADGGTSQLRRYDSAGRLSRVFGGPGGGPEEFAGLSRMWVDSLDRDSLSRISFTSRSLFRWIIASHVPST